MNTFFNSLVGLLRETQLYLSNPIQRSSHLNRVTKTLLAFSITMGLASAVTADELEIDKICLSDGIQLGVYLEEAIGCQRGIAADCYGAGAKKYFDECSPVDMPKALELLQQAADLNHAEAQHLLAIIYYQGDKITPDYKKAVALYKKAANQNHVRAQFQLGNLYYRGEVVEQNTEQAIYWYDKAAQQNYPSAQYFLGVIYIISDETENTTKGIELLQKAAGQGHERAQEALTKLGM